MRPHITASHPTIRRKTERINIVAAGLAVLWVLLIGLTLTPEVDDFRYFRQGALDQLATGDPYTSLPEWQPGARPRAETTPDKVDAFLYPPPLAYLLQPLALLGHAQGQLIWFGLNCVALAGLVALCVRLSGSALARRYWGVVVLGTVIAPPTRLCLQLGQLGILLALLIVGGYALARRRAALSGVLLAIASIIKLYPALLALYYALRRRWSVFWWAIVGGSLLFALSLLIYGVEPYLGYVRKVLPSGYYPYAAEFNISLIGFWDRLLSASPYAVPLADLPIAARLLAVLFGALMLGLCVRAVRGAARDELEEQLRFGLWLCAMLLLSPINGSYNLVLLLFPLLAVLRYLEQHRDPRTRNLLIAATALACWPPAWTDWQPTLYNTLHVGLGVLLLTPAFYGLALYLWLLARLLRRPGPLGETP